MKTTLGEIKKFDPCISGWITLCRTLGTRDLDTEVSILQILESNGVEDAFWALCTQKYEDYCLILADIAESILPIFEKKFPNDDTARNAIQAIRDYKAGEISEIELKKIVNTVAVTYTAITTTISSFYTAYDAARLSVHTAATYAAPRNTTVDIIVNEDDAARYAYIDVIYAVREIQWQINEEILRKHLEDQK